MSFGFGCDLQVLADELFGLPSRNWCVNVLKLVILHHAGVFTVIRAFHYSCIYTRMYVYVFPPPSILYYIND